MKPKLILGLALVLSGLVATVAFSQTNNGSSLTPQEIAKKALDTYAALASYSDTGKTIESKAGQTNTTTFSIRLQRPNLFKIHWVQTSENQTNEGTWWSDGHPVFSSDDTYLLTTNSRPAIESIPFALTAVAAASQQATMVPDIFLKLDPPADDFLTFIAAGKSNSAHTRTELIDGKVGSVDCYIISITSDAMNLPNYHYHAGKKATRLWIGKQDCLLHQIQSISEAPDTMMTQTHENISVNEKFSAADFEEEIPENNSSITLHSTPPATTHVQPSQK